MLQGVALVPLDVRPQLEDLLAAGAAQLGEGVAPRGEGGVDGRLVLRRHLAEVEGHGEGLVLDPGAGDGRDRFFEAGAGGGEDVGEVLAAPYPPAELLGGVHVEPVRAGVDQSVERHHLLAGRPGRGR